MFTERSSPVHPTNPEETQQAGQPAADAANQPDYEAIAARVKAEQSASRQAGDILSTPENPASSNPDNILTPPTLPEPSAPAAPELSPPTQLEIPQTTVQTTPIGEPGPASPASPEITQTSQELEQAKKDAETVQADLNAINVARENLQRVTTHQEEILRNGPRNIDELVILINSFTYQQLSHHERTKKYGEGSLGRFKEFLAGERDFRVDEDGQIRRTGWNRCAEAGRKVLQTVFNRRTVAATGVAAVLGVLTGGVGAAAGGVIFGSMAGRGTAELVDSLTGGERGARYEIIRAEQERWHELKKLSAEMRQSEDPAKKTELMTQITDIYYRQSQQPVVQRLKLAQENLENQQQKLNKLRSRLQTVGEIGGLGAGVLHGFLTGHFASIDIDLWNKAKDQSLMHEVVKLDDTWHFVYKEAEQAAAKAAADQGTLILVQKGGKLLHALGEPAWKIGVATAVERGAPVLMAAFSAAVFGRKMEQRAAKTQQEYQARQVKLAKQRVVETIPKPPTPEPPPAPRPEKRWTKDRLAKLAEEKGVIIPEGPSDLPKEWTGDVDKLRKYFRIDENGEIKTDKLPEWQKIDVNGNLKLDQDRKPILARVVKVDVDRNRIDIIKRLRVKKTGKIFFGHQKLVLNEFLSQYRPRVERGLPGEEAPPQTPPTGTAQKPTEVQRGTIEERAEQIKQDLVGKQIAISFTQGRRDGNIIAEPQRYTYTGEQFRIRPADSIQPPRNFWAPLNQRVQTETSFQETMVVEDVTVITRDGTKEIVLKVKPKPSS